MFGKKQSQEAKPPLVVRVLTPDYLIEGTWEPGDHRFLTICASEGGVGSSTSVQLNQVQIQPIRAEGGSAKTVNTFMARGDQVIAEIPRSDLPITEYNYWKEFKKPLNGAFYCGPYLIRGTMMLINKDVIEHIQPMTDVRITSLRPEDKLSEISAAFALVNTRWLSGYEPL